MFNSCNFNNLKYNSVCIREAVTIIKPPTGGTADIKVRQRKLRRLRIEFFNIVGTKFGYVGWDEATNKMIIQGAPEKTLELRADADNSGIKSVYPIKSAICAL